MDISGPRAINSIDALSKPELGLRLFQRVTAQVLDVTGTTAVLSVEGIPIVAQLTSTDQAATLLTRHAAHFIVTQLTSQKITLKMIGDDTSETSLGSVSSTGTELAVRVLEENNVPVTDRTLALARAILRQHLPVAKGLLNELINSLEDHGNWGNAEADLAAALEAADLPVTAESIDLASRQPEKVGDAVSRLTRLIKDMADQNLPAEELEQLNHNLQFLRGSVLDGIDEVATLVKQLRSMLEALGRSQENLLLAKSQNADSNSSETGLLGLVRLQQMLKQAERNETTEAISKFLQDIRSQQFLNIKSDWLDISFPLQNIKADPEFSSARLRVSRESQMRSGKIDPSSTRFILQVDVDSKETVEVDLSIAGKQVRTSVTATSPVLCQQAEDGFPSLDQALRNLGFTLQDAKVSVGEPQQFRRLNVMPNTTPIMTVDIEI